jgi:Flp pilus assembly protein TadD
MQRAESLTGLLLLLTLYAAVRRFDGGGPLWTVLAVAACILGMGVKQTMFAAPALVLLYDYTFVAGRFGRALRTRPGLYTGLALSWALLAALIVVWQMNDPWPELGARNPWPYALTQPSVILYYLRLAFWPDPIVMLYAWPYASTSLQIVPPLLVMGLLAILTVWGIWRRSWLGFVGTWFFLILGPSSSFAALEQVAQCHRMYLPLAAVSVLAVVAACTTLAWIVRRKGGEAHTITVVAVVLVAGVAGALAWGTMRRNLIYRNELTFWQDNVTRQSESRAALSALGCEYAIRKRTAEAEACFRRALEVNDSPMPVDVYYNLGLLKLSDGRFDEALAHFQAAHDLRPYHAGAVERMGAALAAKGEFPAAVEQLEKALDMQPNAAVSAAAHNNLGVIQSHQGRLEQAASHYRLATQLQPNSSEAYGNLGSTLVRLNRFEEALVPYEAALRIKPNNPDFHNNLGYALLRLQRYSAAAAEFRVALGIKPNHKLARQNLQTTISAAKSGVAAPTEGDPGQ